MKIEANKIKGFNKLNEQCQAIFNETYNRHYLSMGLSMQEAMTPTSVKFTRSSEGSYLKVIFNTGDWYHYLPNGVYY